MPYRINLASTPSTLSRDAARAAVDQGFGVWAEPRCTTWRASNAGTTTLARARANDDENSVLWISDSWPEELGDADTTIGVTTSLYRRGGHYIDADIQFNNVRFRWNTTGIGGVDTQTIATHEAGHFLGLGHSDAGGAVMYPYYSGGTRRVLDADDRAGVCAIYPSGVSEPPPDAGTGTDAGGGGGGFGDDCDASRRCEAGLACYCRTASDCSCTPSCSALLSCPVGYNCSTTSQGQLCVPLGETVVDRGTGEPCVVAAQCASGLCLRRGDEAFCSQVCIDDCSCPGGMTCGRAGSTSNQYCIPGANGCAATDAGADAGGGVDAGGDGDPQPPDSGPPRGPGERAGCGCRAPGHSPSAAPAALALAGALASALGLRRRRRR